VNPNLRTGDSLLLGYSLGCKSRLTFSPLSYGENSSPPRKVNVPQKEVVEQLLITAWILAYSYSNLGQPTPTRNTLLPQERDMYGLLRGSLSFSFPIFVRACA